MIRIDPSEYHYDLPGEKIARFPLKNREDSKLLVYDQGKIGHRYFRDIDQHLSKDATLFFNETRVIPARLIFRKPTGARIELFLLEPVAPSRIMQEAMTATGSVEWSCMIGNLKKWKAAEILILDLSLVGKSVGLQAELVDREEKRVRFSWSDPSATFSEIVTASGRIPLPPYIKREAEELDRERYQTVYSRNDGAVAAPTAGLHFTPGVMKKLEEKGITFSNLTLHVSAGTFQPIKVRDAMEHPMHSEQVLVSQENLKAILKAEKIIAVGTTSLRTLESLYWYGVALASDPAAEFRIEKLQSYKKYKNIIPLHDSISHILDKMQKMKQEELVGSTEIFIFPGYEFRVCDGLITNYHLPGSTLILLVAAFIGDSWKKIYDEALQNDYRFLSYGDSSLLYR